MKENANFKSGIVDMSENARHHLRISLVEAISANVYRQVHYPACVFNARSVRLPTVVELKIDDTLSTRAKKIHRLLIIPSDTIVFSSYML